MTHLLPRRWGEVNKRGQILLIFGAIWVAIGINVLQAPLPSGWEHIWLFREVPVPLRAGAWIFTGLVAMAYAVRPRWIHHDGLGFLALYVMPTERAVGLLWGWLDSVMPFGGPGYPAGILGGLVYLVIVAAVLVIADWPNPPDNDP